jgi:hypothetical protein
MFEIKHKRRTWGFRFSLTDAVVIVMCSVAAYLLARIDHPLWWVLLIVAGHFFIFCNVFRVRRRFEVGWAISFLLNCAVWILLGHLDWIHVLLTQLPFTAAAVFAEVRSNRYHGIFAQSANPRLNDYLGGRIP